MASKDQLRAWLTEAEAALHALSLGQGEAAVRDADGRQVTYSAANLVQLRAYIADLKRQLGQGGYRAIGVRY